MRPLHVMAIATAAICATMALTARAQVPVSQGADIARVEHYLSGLTSISADFTQTDLKGKTSKGKFYLMRPGKMRWQYAPPAPITIVSDGKTITYYDAELDQVSYIGVDETLAGFLAQKEIKLESKTTKLVKFEKQQDGTIRATMAQRNKPDEGTLTLELSGEPLLIKRMSIVDATGQVAKVELENARFGDPLDKRLFVFEDPRPNRNTGR